MQRLHPASCENKISLNLHLPSKLTTCRTIPFVVARLVLLAQTPDGRIPSFTPSNLAIKTTVHTNLSIIAACIPFFKPIMDSLQSGIYAADLRSLNPGGLSYGNSYPLKERAVAKLSSKDWPKSSSNGVSANVTSSGGGKQITESEETMIIRQQTTIRVEEGCPDA